MVEEKITCKNPHCNGRSFVAVIETDNNLLIGIKCTNCQARYSMKDIEIKKNLKRDGYWNSVMWDLKH